MYTVKIMNDEGESIRLYSASHVVIDKKLGTIDVCNTGKPTTRVTLPDDGDVVYVVNANNRTVETLRTPVDVDVTTHQDHSSMVMHTTRSPAAATATVDTPNSSNNQEQEGEDTTHA